MRHLALALASLFAASASAAKIENVWKQRWKKQNALERVTKRYEAMLPESARKPSGEIDKNHPEYKRLEPQWKAQMNATRAQHNQRDERGRMLEDIKSGSIGEKFENTGSPPKDLGSDVDLTPKNYSKNHSQGHADVRVLRDHLKAKGYTVVELDDRIVVREADMTVWKPVRQEKTGSSAADARVHEAARKGSDKFPTEGGMHATTKASQGVEDPAGAVASNFKKAADAGLGGPPETMDLHAAGKSVAKSMEAAGTVDKNKAVYEKAKGVQRHLTDAEAGIVDFGDSPEVKTRKRAEFQKDLKGELKGAWTAAGKQSAALDAARSREAQKAFKNGSYQEGVAIRERQIRAKASNEVALAEIARTDAALVKEVVGVDTTRPRDRAKLRAKATELASDVMDRSGQPPAAAPVEPGSFGAQAKRWGDKINNGVGMLASGFGAAEAEMEEAIRQNRAPNPFRAAGKALWEATGIPGAMGAWEQAANLRDEELAKADARWGDKHWGIEARLKASGRMVSSVAGWDAAGQIANEEILHEEERARKAGEEPNYLRSTGMATLRHLGTVVGIDKIAQAATRDWPAEARWAKQQRTLTAFAQARLSEDLDNVAWVQGRIREVLAQGDPSQPGTQARLEALMSQYAQAREGLARAAQGMRKALGADAPVVVALYDALKDVPPLESQQAQAAADVRQARPEAGPEPGEPAQSKEDPGIDLWIADAAGAAQRCDFSEANRFAGYIVRRAPDHAWSKSQLDAVMAGHRGQEKARAAIKTAEAKLASDNTEAASAAAATAAQEAPLCMHGEIAALVARIQARHDELEIEREQELAKKAQKRAQAEQRRRQRDEQARQRAAQAGSNPAIGLQVLTSVLGQLKGMQGSRPAAPAQATPAPPSAPASGCARDFSFEMAGIRCHCDGWRYNSSYGACVAGGAPARATAPPSYRPAAPRPSQGVDTSFPKSSCAGVPSNPQGGSVILPDGTECFGDTRF